MRRPTTFPWAAHHAAARFFARQLLPLALFAGCLGLAAPRAQDRPPKRAQDSPQNEPRGRPPTSNRMPLRFDSEVVRMFIQGDSLAIEGIYYLVTSPSRPPIMSFFYPYPEDSLLGGAKTASLAARWEDVDWQTLDFEEYPRAHGVRWRVPLLADTVIVRTVYRQALRAQYGRYIVTTTKAWGRPLTHARFEIYLPENAVPARFSYPFELQTDGGRIFYLYETSRFWPEEDIIVEWEFPILDNSGE